MEVEAEVVGTAVVVVVAVGTAVAFQVVAVAVGTAVVVAVAVAGTVEEDQLAGAVAGTVVHVPLYPYHHMFW